MSANIPQPLVHRVSLGIAPTVAGRYSWASLLDACCAFVSCFLRAAFYFFSQPQQERLQANGQLVPSLHPWSGRLHHRAASACGEDDGDDESSLDGSCYSLPEVSSSAEDLSEWSSLPSWLLRPTKGSGVAGSAACDVGSGLPPLPGSRPDVQLSTALACTSVGTFHLPRQLFAPPPQWQRPIIGRRSCALHSRASLSIESLTIEQAQPIRPSASSFFLPGPHHQLLLPAPLFLPEAIEVGLFCDQGPRSRNEDMAFAMRLDPAMHVACGFRKAVCWGVFDGHNGVEVAEHLSECLPELVSKRCSHIKEHGVAEIASLVLGLEVELHARFLAQWLPNDRDPGSTALVASIMDDTLLIANVGDCRLLLISEAIDQLGNRTAFVSNTTSDHHCARNSHEARRVAAAGGIIDESGYIGSLLEVSRSIGDFSTKVELGSGVVIAEPEVYTWKLGPRDLLAVAVSDGISSVMNDMEICNLVCSRLNEQRRINDPAHAARELASFAALTSSDNCSAVVVVLKDIPPPAPARRRLFGGRPRCGP